MPRQKISEIDPYDRKQLDVLDSAMSYIDTGDGEPVIFLHGNGTFSYVWRNIIPYVENLGRCLAPDLMGCGESGDIPSGEYTIQNQIKYLEAWIESLDLGDSIHLVLHDWGGPIGFDWAHRHQDRVKSITYMETLVTPLEWEDWPEVRRDIFQKIKSPAGEDMVLRDNLFIDTIETRMVRNLTDTEMNAYRKHYDEPGESRRATLTFARSCPIGGEPADIVAMTERVGAWLETSPIPKFFINAYPGSILTGRQRDYCRTWANQQEQMVIGIHYIQEDSPHLIGEGIARFLGSLS